MHHFVRKLVGRAIPSHRLREETVIVVPAIHQETRVVSSNPAVRKIPVRSRRQPSRILRHPRRQQQQIRKPPPVQRQILNRPLIQQRRHPTPVPLHQPRRVRLPNPSPPPSHCPLPRQLPPRASPHP